jgi:hypothetical protein
VEVTSEIIRYIPDMAVDALTFLLLHNLGSLKRGKVKEDGVNLMNWLAQLASFLAAGEGGWEGWRVEGGLEGQRGRVERAEGGGPGGGGGRNRACLGLLLGGR